MLAAFHAALSVIAAATLANAGAASADPPGTQTILLVKGGYGVGANLLSSSSRTSRESSVPALTSPRTEANALLAATNTASSLTQDLQDAIQSEATVDEAQSQRDAIRKQVAQLTAELDNQNRTQKAMQKENVALKSQVAQFAQELKAEKEAGKALKSKVAKLEKEVKAQAKGRSQTDPTPLPKKHRSLGDEARRVAQGGRQGGSTADDTKVSARHQKTVVMAKKTEAKAVASQKQKVQITRKEKRVASAKKVKEVEESSDATYDADEDIADEAQAEEDTDDDASATSDAGSSSDDDEGLEGKSEKAIVAEAQDADGDTDSSDSDNDN